MQLIDILNDELRIHTSNGISHVLSIENLEAYLDEHGEENYILCADNIDINQKLSEKYINVRIFDQNEYEKIFQTINPNILKLFPQQILRAVAVFELYGDDVIIANLDHVLTIDVYNSGEYGTGSIYPSFESKFTSLKECGYPGPKFTNIDEFIIQDIPNQIGKGVVNGYIGSIRQIINAHLMEYPWINTIVFTGSKMRNFIQFYGKERLEDELKFNFEYADGLVFQGLEKYYQEK